MEVVDNMVQYLTSDSIQLCATTYIQSDISIIFLSITPTHTHTNLKVECEIAELLECNGDLFFDSYLSF